MVADRHQASAPSGYRPIPRTDPPSRAVAFTMRRNGPPMPWGYRLLAIFLAVLFIGWLVMVVW
jgi:hypothetical protein